MDGLSAKVITKFCESCGWAHEVWSTHRAFDDDPRTAILARGEHGPLLTRLSILSQEYTLLQLAKLHDPAVQQRRINLSLDYVIEYGGWDADTRIELVIIRGRLETLIQQLRVPRDRIIAHHDLRSILDDKALGGFENGADIQYFRDLQEFVDLVHDKAIGGPWPFDHLAITDVHVLLNALAGRDAKARKKVT